MTLILKVFRRNCSDLNEFQAIIDSSDPSSSSLPVIDQLPVWETSRPTSQDNICIFLNPPCLNQQFVEVWCCGEHFGGSRLIPSNERCVLGLLLLAYNVMSTPQLIFRGGMNERPQWPPWWRPLINMTVFSRPCTHIGPSHTLTHSLTTRPIQVVWMLTLYSSVKELTDEIKLNQRAAKSKHPPLHVFGPV